MEFLGVLWLPILLSAVFVFVVSSIMHMLLPIHRNDYVGLPGEAEVLSAMRAQNVGPGQYMFPKAESMKEMQTPEMIEKYNQGPVGFAIVFPNGPINMGKSLVQWFLYSLLLSVFVAYLGMLALGRGADYVAVFRVTGTIAVLAYAVAQIPDSIWKGQSWSVTGKHVFDGVVYGLVTAGTFGWLWPGA